MSFVSSIVLARLLEPEDYGCIGLLAIFMLLADAFIDGGFGSALIQKKRPTQEDYSTVFFWNLGVSIVIYLILFFCAPVIARFYKMPLLSDVLRVQGVVLIINALQTVQANQLNKQFRFKKIAITLTGTSVLTLGITIWLAYKGWGVWALVAQNILLVAIPTLVYWATNKWFPKLVFSIRSFKELFGFGVYMLLTSLVSTAVNNIQGLFIGRLYNPAMMGYYSKAHSTERLASNTLSQVVSQVTYPVYSELQDDKVRIILAIKKITAAIAFLVFPLMFLLVLLARPLFILLYSEKWVESIPYFQMLCLAGLAICLQAANSQTIAAIGKSKEMFKWGLVKQLVGVVFVIAGLWLFGIKGMLAGMVMKSWLIYFVNASLVSVYIGYNIWTQLRDLLPILVTALVSFALAYLAGRFCGLGMYLKGGVELAVFLVLYVGIAYVFKLAGMRDVGGIVRPYMQKFFVRGKK
ncbi:MAG: lipopolysaccharide biosynthesis protein [Bacteroidales bacterium]|nr:lipopolysaccharide biosynthesis protein [Bacteroidales bacterium]